MTGRPQLLYHSPITVGGLAAYAHEQSQALVAAGCDVTLVTSADHQPKAEANYTVQHLFPARQRSAPSTPPVLRRAGTLRQLLAQQARLAAFIAERRFKHILMGAYVEYAAPLWAWRFRRLVADGCVFGAMVHDPVRDYVVGPGWWHRRSIAEGYSFLREAFVHAPIDLETGRPASALRTTIVPLGPFRYPPASVTGDTVRQQIGIPNTATLLLAFGHVRDGKNLQLAIEAIADMPGVHLLVAGTAPGTANQPIAVYQESARRHSVEDRCHWRIGYIPDDEVSGLFAAADIVLLTYSRNFRSASGVLNTARTFRKPCLVSSGEGNLRQVVREYNLGAWVEPDRSDAIRGGLRAMIAQPPSPRWCDYERDNSWVANAALVIDRMFLS